MSEAAVDRLSRIPLARRSVAPRKCCEPGLRAGVRQGAKGPFAIRSVLILVQFVETDETRRTLDLK